jgi:phosphatidylcholine synthase
MVGRGRGRLVVNDRAIGPGRRILAWAVHAYTALGLVAAAGMAVLIVRGDPAAFRGSFALMIVATVIDATDGTLARRVGVKHVLPGFDGRRLDDITDFLNYAVLPLMLIWRAGILPAGWEGWLVLPLLASAYGFCQASIKTDDGYFLGFPSLWNVVAFYAYVLGLHGFVALASTIVLAFLTFVPSKYLYPSQPGRLNRGSGILGVAWGLSLAYVVWRMPGRDGLVVAWGSLVYPIAYMIVSWVVSLRAYLARAK